MNKYPLNYSNSFLITASEYGDLNKVKEAINAGANIHFDRDLALRLAALHGHLDVVKYLVKMGANVSTCNNEALKNTEINSHHETAQFLRLCMKDDKMSQNLIKIILKDV